MGKLNEPSPVNERRKAYRFPVSTLMTCQLKIVDQEYQGSIRDMSATGLYVELEDKLKVAETCVVEILFHGKNSCLKIEGLQGRIVRADEDGIAVQFDARMEWFAMLSICCQRGV